MKLSDGIIALKACIKQFGDVDFNFVTSEEGNPAVELRDVDTAEDEMRRFNARFPTKNIFIPSRN